VQVEPDGERGSRLRATALQESLDALAISVRRPSASGTRRTLSAISSSKLGQPQWLSNLSFER
jgi:hypothetical protein